MLSWLVLVVALGSVEGRGDAEGQTLHEIVGQVRHQATRAPIVHALVALQCACLEGTRTTHTDHRGWYRFAGLPSGTYTIQVLYRHTDVAKVITLRGRE